MGAIGWNQQSSAWPSSAVTKSHRSAESIFSSCGRCRHLSVIDFRVYNFYTAHDLFMRIIVIGTNHGGRGNMFSQTWIRRRRQGDARGDMSPSDFSPSVSNSKTKTSQGCQVSSSSLLQVADQIKEGSWLPNGSKKFNA